MINFFQQLFAADGHLLILGFGREGMSTYRYLRSHFPEVKLGIADQDVAIANHPLIKSDTKVVLHLGASYLDSLADYSFVMKSPGISTVNLSVPPSCEISSQTDLFLRYYHQQTIGVTGTKGKSTTASLIHHLLVSAGRHSLLLGNIGRPCFDEIRHIDSETLIVFELSAHQLEFISNAPHIALLLNIFQEHLDHFRGYENYRQAKLNIARYQQEGDVLIIDQSLTDHCGFSRYLSVGTTDEPLSDVVVSESEIKLNATGVILPLAKDGQPLMGIHNVKNMAAAMLAVKAVGIQFEKALPFLSTFKALAHRMEKLGPFGEVLFVNDSISTVPESTIAAVRSLEAVDCLILGGYDRGLDFTELVRFLEERPIHTFVFLGKAGRVMYNMFHKEQRDSNRLFMVENMEEAFILMKKRKHLIKMCLLSPAAASYDQYKNFEHRGDQFKLLARKYFGQA